MKYLLIVSLVLMHNTAALAACHAGQMTTLLAPYQVYKKDATGNLQAIALPVGTEVHVISTQTEAIEIYAMNENGLGTISVALRPILKCQE